MREAQAAAEFDHPNLVPVFEAGEIGPVCYIATAYCPGQTLAEWLDRQAFPVPVRQAARWSPRWPKPFSTPTTAAFFTATSNRTT